MRLGNFLENGNEFEDLVSRWFNSPAQSWASGAYSVPTDVFHTDEGLVIRMELAGVGPDDVEVTVQENTLLINGTRKFPFDADKVRFIRRGSFYGDFTQRVALGKGLNIEGISANYDNGVLVLTVPYAEEIQPKKIAIEVGGGRALAE